MKSYTFKEHCLFCNQQHCIAELKLRPLFLELNAFCAFADMDQKFLINNAEITINFQSNTISYYLNDDILLSELKFNGDKSFFFSEPPDLSWISKDYNNLPEIITIINTIKSGWPYDNLATHGIEVIR